MNVPIYPYLEIVEVTDEKDDRKLKSKLHFSWEQFFNQLQTELQDNLSNDGYVIPPRSNTDIFNLSAYIQQQIAAGNADFLEDCRILYNITTNQLILIKLGVISVIG